MRTQSRPEPCAARPLSVAEAKNLLAAVKPKERLYLASLYGDSLTGLLARLSPQDDNDLADGWFGCEHEDYAMHPVFLMSGLNTTRSADIIIFESEHLTPACVDRVAILLFSTYDVNRVSTQLAIESTLENILQRSVFEREVVYDRALFIEGRRTGLAIYGALRKDLLATP